MWQITRKGDKIRVRKAGVDYATVIQMAPTPEEEARVFRNAHDALSTPFEYFEVMAEYFEAGAPEEFTRA